MEQTLAMIKPDAVKNNCIGKIINKYEEAGLKIRAMKYMHLNLRDAKAFYAVHAERPFYASLCEFMSSGPIVALVLEGEDAIARNRKLMGATNPEQAEAGTIRKEFATNIENNAVHGSDAPETAKNEIKFFFSELEFA